MTKTRVRLDAIGYGDTVEVEGHVYIVNSLEGPDLHGSYDLYLLDRAGVQHHKVVTSGIDLYYGQ